MPSTVVYYAVPTVILSLIALRKIFERKWGKCRNQVKLTGKIAIVTGANSGIGYEIAKELAERNAQVIVVARTLDKATEAITRILKKIRNTSAVLIPMEVELGSLKSIKRFAKEIQTKYPEIHLLINNAGLHYPSNIQLQTEDGFEIHFGVNYLGQFYLTQLLLPQLTRDSRIVMVASSLHEKGRINLEDLNGTRSEKANLYANSKLACIYFCREFAKRSRQVNIYAVCPGWVYTKLFRNSLKWYHYILLAPVALVYMRSPKQGAQTPIYCATEPSLSSESGNIYRDCRRYNSQVMFSEDISRKLWDKTEIMISNVISS